MKVTTVQELIELLSKVEDKSQTIHVWDRWGYYSTDLIIKVAEDQETKPLMIEGTGF